MSSMSSASASGGIGENNLAFKVTRKRFVIETFHLDVEGGVGERRTTPAPSTVIEGSGHRQHEDGEGKSHAEAKVQIVSTPQPVKEGAGGAEGERPITEEGGTGILKKAKKRVGFQVSRPDVLDF